MSKIDETLKAWADHWTALGVPAIEAEAIAVGTFARGVVYARLVRLEAVAAAARAVTRDATEGGVIWEEGWGTIALPSEVWQAFLGALAQLDKEE